MNASTNSTDWDIVAGSYEMTHLRGRPAGKHRIPIDFGAIGSGLPAAIGVAAARNNGKVLLTAYLCGRPSRRGSAALPRRL
jgi:hypothetical protein